MDSSILTKLEEEEKEAEKLMYGDQTTGTDEGEAGPDQESEVTLEAPDDQDDGDDQPTGEKNKRTDWKNRFTRYKASTDLTINQLRQDRAKLVSDVDDLKTRLSEVMKKFKSMEAKHAESFDPTEGIITPEQEELLGPEAVTVLKNIAKTLIVQAREGTQPEVDTLREQLEELQRKRAEETKKAAELEQRQDMANFKDRLVRAVPDFDKLDVDEKFGEYLEGVDEASGYPRVHLYKTAIQGRDVLGVARFYNDFRSTKPKTRKDILEESVSPVGDSASTSSPLDASSGSKKRYSIQDYNTFMDDQSKGLYRGREKEARQKEMMFDKAFVEDRINY